ncbi:MAG: ferrous iron transporter B, partial [Deltaproteobacteria bacterium]|nr:ferrous iron transporter B [Deltaproteobacteria bacterium]
AGFVAKEIVVSTMGILYAADGNKDSEALKNALLSSDMTPLGALSMMVFVLLYMPCLATLAAIRRETASWKWMIFSISYSTILAWTAAFIVYQGGMIILT